MTYVATAATLGTFSEAASTPFGSYVDYILDDKVGTGTLLAWGGAWLVECLTIPLSASSLRQTCSPILPVLPLNDGRAGPCSF